MIYFDSDVLIHYFIAQDQNKNDLAVELYKNATEHGLFICSLLSLQETSYVLSRLKVEVEDIEKMIQSLIPQTINYEVSHFKRAIQLAKKVGFQNINDCIHTAIAESCCSEMYTFNGSDFQKIQDQTNLKIRIL